MVGYPQNILKVFRVGMVGGNGDGFELGAEGVLIRRITGIVRGIVSHHTVLINSVGIQVFQGVGFGGDVGY